MIKNIYIAGPLFNAHERSYLELIVPNWKGVATIAFCPIGINPELMTLSWKARI